MKRLILALILLSSTAYAEVTTRPEITGTFSENFYVKSSGFVDYSTQGFDLANHFGNMSTTNVSNWQTAVCQVSECNGVHTHEFGENACEITFKSISTVQMEEGCTIHTDDGTETDFEPGTFDNINPDFVNSSVWIGINSSGIVQQSNDFTSAQRISTKPLARLQAPNSGSQEVETIMDVRFKASKLEWRIQNWIRDFIGALAGSGLEVREVGTRNLEIDGGTFSDTEMEGHQTAAFGPLSGITAFTNSSGIYTVTEGLITIDNVQYDTGTGLDDMTNNNWFASHNLAMSTAGGTVNGIDTGRDPTFIHIYSRGQWNSQGEALEQPFNLGPFAGSKEIIRLARFIIKKNDTNINQVVQVQPFNTSGSGTGVAGTQSLNQVYTNSPNGTTPEITTNTTNNDVTFRYGGDNGKIIELQKANGNPVFTAYSSGLNQARIHIIDQKPQNTDGGTPVAVSWNIRDLNFKAYDNLGFANITANRIRLDVGSGFKKFDYCAWAPVYRVERHRLRLWNVTDNIQVGEIGTSLYKDPNTPTSSDVGRVCGYFEMSGIKEFRLEQWTQSAIGGSIGLGVPSNVDPESFGGIIIEESLRR